MYRFNQHSKGSGEIFDVVLSGGSPWGFTLQGGSEFRTKLCVLKVSNLTSAFFPGMFGLFSNDRSRVGN